MIIERKDGTFGLPPKVQSNKDAVEQFVRDYCRERGYDLWMQFPYHSTTKFIFDKGGHTFAEVEVRFDEVENIFNTVHSIITHVDESYEKRPPEGYIDTDIANDVYKQMLNDIYGARSKATYIPYKEAMLKNLNDTYGPMADYFLTDIEMTRKVSKMISFTIKDVIFNDPATIVFWMDGTKTVVKTQDDDIFDPEKGLAMAIAKKVYGNQGNYYNKLKKWLPEEETEEETETSDFKNFISNLPSYPADQWAYIAKRLKDSFKEDK